MRRALLVLAGLACSRQPETRPAAGLDTASLGAVPPSVTTADTATVDVPLTLPSQLYVENDATIYARSTGIVEAITVDLGSRVVPGQAIARLESTDQRIALTQAREKFTNTRQMVERQRALKVAGVVTQADSERVEFEHREATLALQKAQREYDLTRIEAPFSGVVTSRSARLHRLVRLGDSLFRITALRPVLAAIRIPESSAASINIGSRAVVIGPGGVKGEAKVIRASPTLEPGSGTREMILQLTGKDQFTPGSNVTVQLGAERRQVIAIPRTAVAQDGYALIWSDHNTTLRPITLGSLIGEDRIEVISGLVAGEKILRTAP